MEEMRGALRESCQVRHSATWPEQPSPSLLHASTALHASQALKAKVKAKEELCIRLMRAVNSILVGFAVSFK